MRSLHGAFLVVVGTLGVLNLVIPFPKHDATTSLLLLFHEDSRPLSSDSSSPLYDKTLHYSSQVDRVWLQNQDSPPPAMLLLTTLGWNQRNQTEGLGIYRGLRTRGLVEGVINHPWFHPTGWEDLNAGRMEISNTTRYYVFLDRETCGEKNYPNYNGALEGNQDRMHGNGGGGLRQLLVDEVMRSRLFRETTHAHYVLFECGGFGPKAHFLEARAKYPGPRLVFASLSATNAQVEPHDVGLPPPACHPCNLTTTQRQSIAQCQDDQTSNNNNKKKKRSILLSFSGKKKRSQTRSDLKSLHNGKDVRIEKRGVEDMGKNLHKIVLKSIFGAAPRGDNLFSYRFTETMSCGTIPVLYADDWLLPFRSSLLDWTRAIVMIPEIDTNDTLRILDTISTEERCRMRQTMLDWYDRYLADDTKVIAGIVESLERYFAPSQAR